MCRQIPNKTMMTVQKMPSLKLRSPLKASLIPNKANLKERNNALKVYVILSDYINRPNSPLLSMVPLPLFFHSDYITSFFKNHSGIFMIYFLSDPCLCERSTL